MAALHELITPIVAHKNGDFDKYAEIVRAIAFSVGVLDAHIWEHEINKKALLKAKHRLCAVLGDETGEDIGEMDNDID